MATIYLSLSAKSDTNPQKEIRIRFKHGKTDQQAKTNIFIPAEYWDEKEQQINIPNFRLKTDEKKELIKHLTEQSEKLSMLTATIQTLFNEADKCDIPSDWLKLVIDKFNFPEKYIPKTEEVEPKTVTLFQFIDKFIKEAPNRKDKSTGRLLTYNNIQQYKATEKHLKDFAKSIRKKDFDFADIGCFFISFTSKIAPFLR